MIFTSSEMDTVCSYLIDKLKENNFDVSYNPRYLAIRRVGKKGVWCYPAICRSSVEGKNSYNYLSLEVVGNAKGDLGYYYKSRYDGTSYKRPTNACIDKYAPTQERKIDINNYKKVIDDFVKNLNIDYNNIKKGK